MLAVLLPLLNLMGAEPEKKAAPAPSVIVIDDRATKDQAPGPFLDSAERELKRRAHVRVARLSALRSSLKPDDERALTRCGDDPGCLATAARLVGAHTVVFLRVTQREGESARFVSTTRVNALRPQLTEDAGAIAGTERDALQLVVDQINELFEELELAAPLTGPVLAPTSAPAPAPSAPPPPAGPPASNQ